MRCLAKLIFHKWSFKHCLGTQASLDPRPESINFNACFLTPFLKRLACSFIGNLILFLQRFLKNLSEIFLFTKSFLQPAFAHANCICPFFDRFTLSSIIYSSDYRSIVALGFIRCPSNITRFVVTIVINPIYRVVRGGGFPNIVKESFKIIQPLIANFYSAATINMKAIMFRVVASRFHISPSGMLLSSSPAKAVTMLVESTVLSWLKRCSCFHGNILHRNFLGVKANG